KVDIVIERVLAGEDAESVRTSLADVPILPVIAGVRDQQAPAWQRCGGRAVVEQGVAVRDQNRTDPLIAIAIDSIRQPNRTNLRTEIVLTGSSEKPNSAARVRKNAGDVVVNVGTDSRTFVGFGEGAGGRTSGRGFGSATATR